MNGIEAMHAEAALRRVPQRQRIGGRPWLFALLSAPAAMVVNGVIQGGVLAYIFSQRGIESGEQSHQIFLLALPTMIYFIWSPLTDFLVRRRTWLLIGGVSAGVLMTADCRPSS